MIHCTPEQRFSLYYAALFGSLGVVAPFAALWMDDIGISAAMIGLIVAAPSVAMLLTTIALGRWADSLENRALAIVAGNWVIFVAQLGLFFYTGQWWVLVVWLVSGIAMYAMMPITDAAALSMVRQRGSDYARIRVFGSIGYIVTLLVCGYIFERFGVGIFIWMLALVNIARLASACFLSHPSQSRARQPTPKPQVKTVQSSRPGVKSNPLYQPAILLTLAAGALINASHAMVNTYGILLWTRQGLSESVASMAIGIGVLVEVGLMWWFTSLTRKVSARVCLLVAALCGLVRWLLLANDPSIVVVFAAQALHGFTFGVMFLSCASFISRRVPESSAARGQGLLATMTTACMASATFASGQLFDRWADSLYGLMGGLCVLAMVCIAYSYRFPLSDEQR